MRDNILTNILSTVPLGTARLCELSIVTFLGSNQEVQYVKHSYSTQIILLSKTLNALWQFFLKQSGTSREHVSQNV